MLWVIVILFLSVLIYVISIITFFEFNYNTKKNLNLTIHVKQFESCKFLHMTCNKETAHIVRSKLPNY